MTKESTNFASIPMIWNEQDIHPDFESIIDGGKKIMSDQQIQLGSYT